MSIEDPEDIEGLRLAGEAVARARDAMGAAVAPGVTTAELDAIGRDVLARHGARSAPQLAYGFPGTTCISVNDALAHGIPSEQVLAEGDLVNIDVSAELDGYWADTGASYPVGAVNVNGDLPVILGPDGPTAGGFVVAATVAHAGFWKIGQLRPVGDSLRFREVTIDEATELDRELDARLTEASLEDA